MLLNSKAATGLQSDVKACGNTRALWIQALQIHKKENNPQATLGWTLCYQMK